MVKLPLAKKWKKVKIRITKSWKRFPKEDRQVKILEEVWRKAADLILGVQAIATSPQAAWPEADPQPVDDQVLGVVTAESHRAQAQDLVLVGPLRRQREKSPPHGWRISKSNRREDTEPLRRRP